MDFNARVQVGINWDGGGTYYDYYDNVDYVEFTNDTWDEDDNTYLYIVYKSKDGEVRNARYRSDTVESFKIKHMHF